jgi:hypothetical protein
LQSQLSHIQSAFASGAVTAAVKERIKALSMPAKAVLNIAVS